MNRSVLPTRVISCFLLAVLGALCAVVDGAEPQWTVNVWPGTAPGESGDMAAETEQPRRPDEAKPVKRITNVSVPTLSVYVPQDVPANGAAVIICPGGGYNILAYDKEGTEVAEWLNSIGVTGIVLKYRVPRRSETMPQIAPLQDVQRSVRLVRHNAEKWSVDPERLGVLGFSAGGHLTVMAGSHYAVRTYDPFDTVDRLSARPDFLIPIYAAYLTEEEKGEQLCDYLRLGAQTPPMFLAVAYNDKERAVAAARLFIALKEVGVNAELHVYSGGGHGFGLRPSRYPAHTWPDRCADWLRINGWLNPVNE